MDYELTITLHPMMYRMKPENQHIVCMKYLPKILKKFHHCLIAELTEQNNIHYHGIVRLNNLKHRNQLINKFRSHTLVFGRKNVKQLMDFGKWVEYIQKSLVDTYHIIETSPIVNDDYLIISTHHKFEEKIKSFDEILGDELSGDEPSTDNELEGFGDNGSLRSPQPITNIN